MGFADIATRLRRAVDAARDQPQAPAVQAPTPKLFQCRQGHRFYWDPKAVSLFFRYGPEHTVQTARVICFECVLKHLDDTFWADQIIPVAVKTDAGSGLPGAPLRSGPSAGGQVGVDVPGPAQATMTCPTCAREVTRPDHAGPDGALCPGWKS